MLFAIIRLRPKRKTSALSLHLGRRQLAAGALGIAGSCVLSAFRVYAFLQFAGPVVARRLGRVGLSCEPHRSGVKQSKVLSGRS